MDNPKKLATQDEKKKPKTQPNMCQTPLCGNKYKECKVMLRCEYEDFTIIMLNSHHDNLSTTTVPVSTVKILFLVMRNTSLPRRWSYLPRQ